MSLSGFHDIFSAKPIAVSRAMTGRNDKRIMNGEKHCFIRDYKYFDICYKFFGDLLLKKY